MSYLGFRSTFSKVDRVILNVDTLTAVVREADHTYHWKKLRTYAEALFQRAPFKVGDRVRLTKTPEISETKSWGWLGAKHFLVKGAMATVAEVDFSDGHFEAWLHFDDESWMSSIDGKIHPVEEKAMYHFWETQIERVPSDSPSEEKEP